MLLHFLMSSCTLVKRLRKNTSQTTLRGKLQRHIYKHLQHIDLSSYLSYFKRFFYLPVQFYLENTILHTHTTMSNHASKSIIPLIKLDLIFSYVIFLHIICSRDLFYVDKKTRNALLDFFPPIKLAPHKCSKCIN